jgi:hypothetical protein
MNPLTRQLLGETPYPIPKTARGPVQTDLYCKFCGREDLTSDDFYRNRNGNLETKCIDCTLKQMREQKRAKRLAEKLARTVKDAASTVGTAVARWSTRFQIWALRQQYIDQTQLLAQVKDVDTYCAMLRSWAATGRELLTAQRRLDDLVASRLK